MQRAVASRQQSLLLQRPDLNVFQSVSFVPGEDADDANGHGTHVAGTIGALDNDIGVVGVAPGVRLWNLKVIGPTSASWNNFLAAMDYIAQHSNEVSVINASLTNNGIPGAPAVAIRQAISNIVSFGVVFVTTARNFLFDVFGEDEIYGNEDDCIPAAIPEALTVSAMEDRDGLPGDDNIAYFSNYSVSNAPDHHVTSPGKGIDLAAPGVAIDSTYEPV